MNLVVDSAYASRTLLEDGQSLLGNKNGRFEGSWDAVLSCCASQPAIAAE